MPLLPAYIYYIYQYTELSLHLQYCTFIDSNQAHIALVNDSYLFIYNRKYVLYTVRIKQYKRRKKSFSNKGCHFKLIKYFFLETHVLIRKLYNFSAPLKKNILTLLTVAYCLENSTIMLCRL